MHFFVVISYRLKHFFVWNEYIESFVIEKIFSSRHRTII